MQAENILQLLQDWEIKDNIVAVSTDTTASNTGMIILLVNSKNSDISLFAGKK